MFPYLHGKNLADYFCFDFSKHLDLTVCKALDALGDNRQSSSVIMSFDAFKPDADFSIYDRKLLFVIL